MKTRKTKNLIKVLCKKGFVLNPEKNHHQYYFLQVDGKKHNIYTYFSHGLDEYNSNLMASIKKQLKFKESILAEKFFDCPMSGDQYLEMLRKNGDL